MAQPTRWTISSLPESGGSSSNSQATTQPLEVEFRDSQSELGSYFLPEGDEDDIPNNDDLDDHSVTNTSLVSSLSLPSPAFSTTSRSGDKDKTPIYRSKINNNANANRLNSNAGGNSANDNINNALQTIPDPKDNSAMNESGSISASY
ncbi:hypothetical protein BGZ79_004337, partial [Entomortierella chlamydospora]